MTKGKLNINYDRKGSEHIEKKKRKLEHIAIKIVFNILQQEAKGSHPSPEPQ